MPSSSPKAVETLDCLVIGAGVVGLAIARTLSKQGRDVLVLEKEHAIGTHTSSHNSEVIHAGLYYPKNSLKAELCVTGRHALYKYLEERYLPHRKPGKLIVATTPAQLGELTAIAQHARQNGVEDLQQLSPADIRKIEPELDVLGALLSPSTGIIDSHQYMLALQGELEECGGAVAFNTQVISGETSAQGVTLNVVSGSDPNDEPMRLHARHTINSAGLWAPQLAASLTGFPRQHIPETRFAKGNYFSLSSKPPFRHLIYPVPEKAGLGTHLTLDMAGRARFGPDVEWRDGELTDSPDYTVDPARQDSFIKSIQAYWPGLPQENLAPDYAGVRPKISPWDKAQDFQIQEPGTHGVPGLINLFGIESPGLTASLAIADYVAQRCT
ncbi:MAG: NAD(P)/FAD-dependent oxidoreductase [Parvibaculaceae bacterium]|nr:NAD(P)/FAD-dependent oxidoreductase [Parvibaculaceae bacterium]